MQAAHFRSHNPFPGNRRKRCLDKLTDATLCEAVCYYCSVAIVNRDVIQLTYGLDLSKNWGWGDITVRVFRPPTLAVCEEEGRCP